MNKILAFITSIAAVVGILIGIGNFVKTTAEHETRKIVKMEISTMVKMLDFIIDKNGLKKEWINYQKEDENYEKSKTPSSNDF